MVTALLLPLTRSGRHRTWAELERKGPARTAKGTEEACEEGKPHSSPDPPPHFLCGFAESLNLRAAALSPVKEGVGLMILESLSAP